MNRRRVGIHAETHIDYLRGMRNGKVDCFQNREQVRVAGIIKRAQRHNHAVRRYGVDDPCAKSAVTVSRLIDLRSNRRSTYGRDSRRGEITCSRSICLCSRERCIQECDVGLIQERDVGLIQKCDVGLIQSCVRNRIRPRQNKVIA